MITFLQTNLFDSPAQTLVNTVNVVGVMGKGIAKQFKQKCPEMFSEYEGLCQDRKLSIGSLHLWRGSRCWVLNFPTKTTWKQPSKIEYIELGLQKFVDTHKSLGVTSISFPPLGCGNGSLEWRDVRPIMETYLSKVDIQVFIHDVQVTAGFVPEHQYTRIPADLGAFTQDIKAITESAHHVFSTRTGRTFSAFVENRDVLLRFAAGKSDRIREEMIAKAYSRLQHGVLMGSNFSSEQELRLKSYLFPIIARLPYVSTATATINGSEGADVQALFVKKLSRGEPTSVEETAGEQGCLSL